jgi:hypothetical protein
LILNLKVIFDFFYENNLLLENILVGWMDASGSHCNPGYSGGRDQEDAGSKPAWANSLRHPILKNRS